jgi:flagellin
MLLHDGAERRTTKVFGHIRRKKMALTVATNTGALMAQAAASSTNKQMEISMERLATGKRINSAADDAAGVAIASRLTSEIRGTNQAIRNAMDGQAMLDTAEGAHIEVENILQRMRELAVQAGNDTNNATDRTNISTELTQLTSEIDRIASTTTWAGQNLLDGTGSFNFQVGSRTTSADTITTAISAMSSAGLAIQTNNATTAATGGNGTTQATSTITVGANTAAASVVSNGTTFTSGVSTFSVASSGTKTPTISMANNVLTLDLVDEIKDKVITVTLNGTTFTAGTGSATSTDTTRSVAADAIMDKIAAFLGFGTVTAQTGSGSAKLTISNNELATDLRAKLNANANYSGAFTAGGTGAAVTSTVKALTPTVTAAATTDNGTGVAGVDATFAANVMTLTKATGTNTSANNTTTVFTVEGQEISFNSFTDGVQKGFDVTDVTNAGLVGAVKQKIIDAGFGGINMALSGATITFTKGGALDVSTSTAANTAVDAIDAAITAVNTQRATLGSVSNRLDSTVSNLTNISANLSAGRGRIEDADFAAETTSLAKSQILQQASTAMLAQANASKQGVLSLLQG